MPPPSHCSLADQLCCVKGKVSPYEIDLVILMHLNGTKRFFFFGLYTRCAMASDYISCHPVIHQLHRGVPGARFSTVVNRCTLISYTPARLSRSIDMPLHPPARQPPESHHPYSRQHCQYSARIICIYHMSYLHFLFLTTHTSKNNKRKWKTSQL